MKSPSAQDVRAARSLGQSESGTLNAGPGLSHRGDDSSITSTTTTTNSRDSTSNVTERSTTRTMTRESEATQSDSSRDDHNSEDENAVFHTRRRTPTPLLNSRTSTPAGSESPEVLDAHSSTPSIAHATPPSSPLLLHATPPSSPSLLHAMMPSPPLPLRAHPTLPSPLRARDSLPSLLHGHSTALRPEDSPTVQSHSTGAIISPLLLRAVPLLSTMTLLLSSGAPSLSPPGAQASKESPDIPLLMSKATNDTNTIGATIPPRPKHNTVQYGTTTKRKARTSDISENTSPPRPTRQTKRAALSLNSSSLPEPGKGDTKLGNRPHRPHESVAKDSIRTLSRAATDAPPEAVGWICCYMITYHQKSYMGPIPYNVGTIHHRYSYQLTYYSSAWLQIPTAQVAVYGFSSLFTSER
jgi:hypothetical protein